jgi:hypothetical protein
MDHCKRWIILPRIALMLRLPAIPVESRLLAGQFHVGSNAHLDNEKR